MVNYKKNNFYIRLKYIKIVKFMVESIDIGNKVYLIIPATLS